MKEFLLGAPGIDLRINLEGYQTIGEVGISVFEN